MLIFSFLFFLLLAQGFQFGPFNSYAEEGANKILIKLKPQFDTRSSGISLKRSISGLARAKKILSLKETGIQILDFSPGEDIDSLISELKSNPYVQYAEKDFKMRFTGWVKKINDPLFNQQWGLRNTGQVINGLGGDSSGLEGADIQIRKGWGISRGKKKIVVAFIDSGIDFTHPDLQKNIWVNKDEIPGNGIDDDGNGYIDDINGWDFVNNDNIPDDEIEFFSHGTNGAGIIAATTNNNEGIAGINWNVSLMVLKISPSLAEAVQAIEYAVKNGARIINASFGENISSDSMKDAISVAGDKGILFVAAADDSPYDNDTNPFYPASYDLSNIISVTATDKNDELAYFASFGKNSIDIAAPGDDIITTSSPGLTGDPYQYVLGTSFATTFVTGVAALALAEKPIIKIAKLKKIILSNTDVLDSLKDRTVTGGRLNAYKVLKAIKK